MHRLVPAAALLTILAPAVHPANAVRAATLVQEKPAEHKMITYQAVLLLVGEDWSPTVTPAVEAHRDYVADLIRSGRAVIGGPFAGDSRSQGFYILKGTAEEAKSIADADPAVKDRRYTAEVLQWMGPDGWFQKPSDLTQTEKIYFGFLVTGPNNAAATAEEQKQLMAAHLSHMDEQAKIGKLVLAGPLVKAGPRRGLIAYRVPTMAEALERASADPMVKAGRMTPELYEWQVPKGILK
jgi:uncharacterized protein YciI